MGFFGTAEELKKENKNQMSFFKSSILIIGGYFLILTVLFMYQLVSGNKVFT